MAARRPPRGFEELLVRFPFFTPFRVVGWGTLALINAGLAESKGRSRLFWGGVSLGAGPLATAYIVFTPSHKHDRFQ